jgi:hypothetical protein
MKRFKQFLVTICLLSILFLAESKVYAQTKECNADLKISSSIMSRYVWRGLQLGGAYPSIQPTMEFSKGGLAIGAWGAFSTNGLQSQEIDLYASYTFAKEMFTFTLTDYFFPGDTVDYNYFVYEKDATSHLFEASLKFNGTEKIPFTLLLATNIYGADTKKLNGDNTFSSYIELGYETKIKEVELSCFLGSALNAPGDDITGFYGNTKTGIINLGVTAAKEIQISDKFSLPISSSLIFNPYAKKIFFVFGFTL